jgi:hypothetical protein
MAVVTGASNNTTPAVDGTNSSRGSGVSGRSQSGSGVQGETAGAAPATGVQGSGGDGRGVTGESTNAEGVLGISVNGAGVSGNGVTGVQGISTSATGKGVSGSGTTGVYGISVRNNGFGVHGHSQTSDGVYGFSQNGAGVHGVCNGPGYAGRFDGNLIVTGRIQARGYDPLPLGARGAGDQGGLAVAEAAARAGVAQLGAAGTAIVQLAGGVDDGRRFSCVLTPIGGPAPDLHVAAAVTGGGFTIAGGAPGAQVSWQLSAVDASNTDPDATRPGDSARS